MTIELDDEEAALLLICVGRSQQEITLFAKYAAEESGKKKMVWTEEMRAGAKRHGRLFKRILKALVQAQNEWLGANMQKQGQTGTRAWTKEEIEDDRLRCFMMRNRKDMLAVLVAANATNPSALTERLVAEWSKEQAPNAEVSGPASNTKQP